MLEKILVVGLGSMGKRRVRNLQFIGYKSIAGFDLREDRRAEANQKYGIETFESFDAAVSAYKPQLLIISVPPDLHHIYMKEAIRLKIPAFIEASVVDTDLDNIIKESALNDVLLVPSSTFYFHPAIRIIESIVKSGELGSLSNVLYHSGQYLPDWHTYEAVSEYYVSNPATGGCREIVPFELCWLTKILGFPTSVTGICKKTIDIPGAPDIYDTCNALFDYNSFMLMLTVDVVSRIATRRLTINGSLRQLRWDWDEKNVNVFDPATGKFKEYPFETLNSESGYNKNITEQMYIDEMKSFVNAALNKGIFENTLVNDKRILELLYSIERSGSQKTFIETL